MEYQNARYQRSPEMQIEYRKIRYPENPEIHKNV